VKFLWITGVALVLDQLTKWWVLQTMTLGESVPVLGSFFKLTYIHNPGAVFGIRLGNPYLHLSLACVALLVVGVLLRRLLPKTASQPLV
jgi:signal peptidase II